MPGFLDGFTDTLRDSLEKTHEEEQSRRKSLRDFYLQGILRADNPDQAQHAADEYGKLQTPDARKKFQQVLPILGRVMGIHKKQQAQQDQPSPADMQMGADGPVSAPPGPSVTQQQPAAPVPTSAVAAFKKGPDLTGVYSTTQDKNKQALNYAKQQSANRREIGEAAGFKGQDLAEFQTGFKPTVSPTGTRKAIHVKTPDGQELFLQQDSKTGQYFDQQNNPTEMPEGATPVENVNWQQEWYHFPGDKPGDDPHGVRINPRNPNQKLDNSTGKPLPDGASQVSPTVLAAQIRKDYYGEYGNLVRSLEGQGYDLTDAQKIAGQQTMAMFQKRYAYLGAQRFHEVIGQDAEGNAIPVQLRGGPTPTSTAPPVPPVPGAPATQTALQSVPQAVLQAPAVPPTTNTAKPPAIPAPVPAPRILEGVSPAVAARAAKTTIPLTESVTQMFDPTVGFVKYAHLADDPEAVKRIGTAVNLTTSALGNHLSDASVSGGAGPVHLSSGGFGQWLSNAMNIPTVVAAGNAQQIRKAMESMKPEEREAYDAIMAEASVMAGLRSLSTASNAQASIDQIQREIPKLFNNAGSDQFYDQLGRISAAVRNAINTPGLLPRVKDRATGKPVPIGIDPKMYERIMNLPEEMQKLKKGPAKAPAAKGTTDLKNMSTEELLKRLK